jgi:dihydrodipicolinate synthase/N-acetylneuraminate lyase
VRSVLRRPGRAADRGRGHQQTRTTIARHEALAEVPGVVASLTVVPYYVRPSAAGIVAHLTEVAERSPVPLVVYNVPYRTGGGWERRRCWNSRRIPASSA